MIAHDIARKMAVYGQLPAKHVVSVLDDLGQTFAQHGFVKKLVHIGVRSGVMWCPIWNCLSESNPLWVRRQCDTKA